MLFCTSLSRRIRCGCFQVKTVKMQAHPFCFLSPGTTFHIWFQNSISGSVKLLQKDGKPATAATGIPYKNIVIGVPKERWVNERRWVVDDLLYKRYLTKTSYCYIRLLSNKHIQILAIFFESSMNGHNIVVREFTITVGCKDYRSLNGLLAFIWVNDCLQSILTEFQY